MVKAIFIDYMGTTVDEHSPEMAEIVGRLCKHSSLHDPKKVQRFILDTRRRYEKDSYLDVYTSLRTRSRSGSSQILRSRSGWWTTAPC